MLVQKDKINFLMRKSKKKKLEKERLEKVKLKIEREKNERHKKEREEKERLEKLEKERIELEKQKKFELENLAKKAREREKLENEKKKNQELEKKEKKEKQIIEKITRIMKVSTRVNLDRMQDVLNMDKTLFNNKIFEWAEEFEFKIDGDYLIVNQDTVSNFLTSLNDLSFIWENTDDV